MLDFLTEATPTSINLHTTWPPRDWKHTVKNWARNFTIAGLYLKTDKILDEIGRSYHMTRENVRQIVKKVVIAIHTNSSQEMQERFSRESFNYRKPLSLAIRKRILKATTAHLFESPC
ncbi:hypothetical protein A2W45_03930 [Candidatus Curtissbacteria bacterium RIFCSPHIGHO2_12_41_11]|uniref:Uncharacterized protein n=2 Tax=Candidatus Curtissiibacteriota TaxID=1752717 RepID=A0A1F5H9G4_9BACT|nr:MAG: hypothetical protein A3D07_02285 [Candidatus Curtissbacteria bacterium RIFCSPHIGHO2_02_FULL_42_15]OGE00748.1 MAG: hypothetical protein A2W45_03930 [Candidatus Curtissbacteria bacterium RIFCSPHIGHO2_12_41_11]